MLSPVLGLARRFAGPVRHRAPAAALALVAALGLSACATPAPTRIAPFASDGCSMFPDRAYVAKADWCACCVAHDLAYWRGGTAEERLEADRALRSCVRAAVGNQVLASTMLAGVRTGGVPYLPTSYRWGYGWGYGRLYAPLSADEEAQATRLREQYMREHPDSACGKPGAIVAETSPAGRAESVASSVAAGVPAGPVAAGPR